MPLIWSLLVRVPLTFGIAVSNIGKWVMERSRGYFRMRAAILLIYLTVAAISLTHCDAERSMRVIKSPKHRKSVTNKHPNKLKMTRHFDFNPSLDSSNAQPYSVSSPFSLPPYESLAPVSLPNTSPPFCVNPPNPPSTSIPTPTGYQQSPPTPYYYTSPALPTQSPPPSPSSSTPGSPVPVLNPPVVWPGPPGSTMSPPYFEPSPPASIPSPSGGSVPNPPNTIPSPSSGFVPSPPSTVPSPTGGNVPSPTVFQPPVVYPPPIEPPPPNTGQNVALWCVAKPTVPDPIMQEAMNYACGSGADCDSIQPNGACFEPDTVYAHASYAFNSYWQRTKLNGGSCEFGGTAILVTVDPSYDGCHFVYE